VFGALLYIFHQLFKLYKAVGSERKHSLCVVGYGVCRRAALYDYAVYIVLRMEHGTHHIDVVKGLYHGAQGVDSELGAGGMDRFSEKLNRNRCGCAAASVYKSSLTRGGVHHKAVFDIVKAAVFEDYDLSSAALFG